MKKTNTSKTLSKSEKEQFKKLDATVRKASGLALQVGAALAEINTKDLYREQYSTFEEYCREVHDYSKSYSYSLITAHETAKKMSAIADKHGLSTDQIPQKESLLRELAKVPTAKAKCRILSEVLKEKDGICTAKDLKAKIQPQIEQDDDRPPPPAVRLERARQQVILLKKKLTSIYDDKLDSDVKMMLDTVLEFMGDAA